MPRPTRGRIALRAMVVFLATFVLLVALLGSILTVRLDLGHYWFTNTRPYAWGTRPSGTGQYSGEFVRSNDGGIYLGGPHAPAPPAGTLLGSADFSTWTTYTGFPRPYFSEWTVTLNRITPAPAGPPLTDARAWTAVISEAISRTRWGANSIPNALRRGESAGTTFAISAFAYNAGWRLLHDPLWPAGALVVSLGIAVAVSWRSVAAMRRGPGMCATCGYDRRGLPVDAVCPECGAGAGDGLMAS